MSLKEGVVLFGINNIYTVFSEGKEYICEIKGKKLKGVENVYNPLAPGDNVIFIPGSDLEGMISERLDRKNDFTRWNNKRNSPQTIAANIDLLVTITSADNPPFRPRFIDRVLVMTEGIIETLIVMNKSDLEMSPDTVRRFYEYKRLGYECLSCSAESGDNINELKEKIKGRICAFAGQSGVGKSSLLNRLFPGNSLKTGEVSEKYNRGRHTTNHSRLFITRSGGFIDTPGIREIEVFGIAEEELGFKFREFNDFSGNCKFQPCLHIAEPGCAVKKALSEGKIDSDRYESYTRILDAIARKEKY